MSILISGSLIEIAQFLSSHLECVIVGSGDNPVVVELQARDDVVVVALEHLRSADPAHAPVHLDVVLAHETRLKGKSQN